MGENIYAVHGLTRKRAELGGQVLILQEQLKEVHRDIEALDHALCLLDPTAEPRTIKPLKPVHRYKYISQGEMHRMLLDTMRGLEGKPTSIGCLAEVVMGLKGLDASHPDTVRAIRHRITTQLHSLNRRGAIQKIGAYAGVKWALPI